MNCGLPPDGSHLSQQHRRDLLRVLLAFTAVFGSVFVVLNFIDGKYGLLGVVAATVLFALALLRIVRRTPHLRRWSLTYLIVLHTGTLFGFMSPQTSITIFTWILVMPVLAHLLLGRWLGGLMSLFYVGVSTAIFFWRFGDAPSVGTPGSVANLATAVACSFVFSHVYEASRELAERQLSQMALTDPLTGLANRAQLEQVFSRVVQQRALPVTLVMIDLDYFKRINDEYGHDTGDAVLREIATTLRAHVRQADLACRLGGEEFCLLLPATQLRAAQQTAERLRAAIEALECRHCGAVLRLTASAGVASTASAATTLETLLRTADQHLYKAKQTGRNRVAA